MTLPLLDGSALNALSWASPTVSNATPTSQTSTPSAATQPSADDVAAATWSGSDTNHAATPCVPKTRTRA